MNQDETPLYSALAKHKSRNPISYHVPGHKNGQLFPQLASTDFGGILQLDVTELTGLDDLHDAEGVIAQAEELTADLYGVQHSSFLINGSTVGNLGMILGTCSKGDRVLVQRNSHKSIINGLQLAEVQPIFISPEYDELVKVPTGVSVRSIKRGIEQYPNTKAIILTYPNYYGHTVELRSIIELAHERNIPVLVDEAHGAHFILKEFPESAVTLGADIVIHSAHKTLPAMTMGSFLHFNSRIIDYRKVKYYLQVLQSSSPSYPIMASLDLARYFLARLDKQGISEIITGIEAFRAGLRQIPQIKVVEPLQATSLTDPLKVTIQSTTGLTGYQLQTILEQNGVYCELADPNNILILMPLSGNKLYNQPLLDILSEQLKDQRPSSTQTNFQTITSDEITELALSYKQITQLDKKVVSLDESIGQIAAEMIVPYPPGIPLLMVGELITLKHINMITSYIHAGARFQGNQFRNLAISVFELRKKEND
jgi:arginine/lysine/ornithine decarboxylase